MTERWRCFVAVPLGEGLRTTLGGAAANWRTASEVAGMRWIDPSAWHVTLAFLGPIEPASVAGVGRAVESVAAAHRPIRLRSGELGAFPSAARARVLWYGIERSAALGSLVSALRVQLGVESGEPFRGHVTLARARGAPVDVRGFLARAVAPGGSLLVDRIELMRSHLGAGPARYGRIATAQLGAGIRV